MPLRDHFRPPLDESRHWEGFHGQWPAMIVQELAGQLPSRYFAEPRVHPGGSAEIDVGTFREGASVPGDGDPARNGGGVATEVWAPSRPTLTAVTDLPREAVYEVQVFDTKRGSRLVAAVEIVSPANRNRPEHRRAFVAKCVALLQSGVSVTIVDLVTIRHFNLYAELLQFLDLHDPSLPPQPLACYAAACREARRDDVWLLEAWAHPLAVGNLLPTLPLWLADDLAVPLDLEASYEATRRILRIA